MGFLAFIEIFIFVSNTLYSNLVLFTGLSTKSRRNLPSWFRILKDVSITDRSSQNIPEREMYMDRTVQKYVSILYRDCISDGNIHVPDYYVNNVKNTIYREDEESGDQWGKKQNKVV